MNVSIEISYYPLVEDFTVPINNFVRQLTNSNIIIETGKMSTIIIGEFSEVMRLLTKAMSELMNNYPSVFNIKISNACMVQNK
jgi:uncharacterized protein YqgV (UPF0045/DUF77 family)